LLTRLDFYTYEVYFNATLKQISKSEASMLEEKIWIITEDVACVSDAQRSYRNDVRDAKVEVSVSHLEQNMSRFLQSISRIFQQAKQQTVVSSGLQLDEITLSVEVSGEGAIALMGTGSKAGGKGAITLKFKYLKDKI
jgi:hypothetical protein